MREEERIVHHTLEADDGVRRLAAAFDIAISPERVAIYVEYMADVDQIDIGIAVERWITSRSHFPSISELRKYFDDMPEVRERRARSIAPRP